MEKKILIPTDFSKPAWNALVYGINLFKDNPCTFYILNVYKTNIFSSEKLPLPLKSESNVNAKEESEEGLARILQGITFRKENPRHKFEIISSGKDFLETIQDIVDKKNIDLILMGARGETVSINAAYNNQLSKVTQKIEQCPILVIPETTPLVPDSFKEIVFPTNFKFTFKLKELDALINISDNLDAPIRVLYIQDEGKKINKEQETNRQVLKDYLSNSNFTFHTLTQTTVPAGIHLFIQSRESTLLAIYKRKRGFFSKLFTQSFVEDIYFHPKIPVLVLKEFD